MKKRLYRLTLCGIAASAIMSALTLSPLAQEMGDLAVAVVEESTEEEQPEESQPEANQPEEGQPEESQPEESQPEESQPEESQPEESQPEESQPEESQPEESQPEENQPEENQPEEGQPEESQPQESQVEENKPERGSQTEVKTDGNTLARRPVFLNKKMEKVQQFKDLKLSSTQIRELISMTGGKMSQERLQVVLHAYSLVGKVNYFWGGKSEQIGWDSRWGQLAVVTSEGSRTTGTTQAYGLDCSGYVTWAFLNAAGDSSIVRNIGHGTSAQWENSKPISEEEALPGDLAFMAQGNATSNHIGIVIGRNEEGQLMFAHCSGSADNVVVTTAQRGSFHYLRRPVVYTDEGIKFADMVEKNTRSMTEDNKELFAKYQELSLMEKMVQSEDKREQ